MALPTQPTGINYNNSSAGYRADLSPQSIAVVGNTAFVAANTSGGAVTCNLATDTLIYRADGCLWDDTQSCWLPPYIYQLPPTPRKA